MIELSVFLLNKFGGKPQDVSKFQFQESHVDEQSSLEEAAVNDEVTALICDHVGYSDQKMPACTRNYIIQLSSTLTKAKKRVENKFIFRKLLNSVLCDDAWSSLDSEQLKVVHKKKLDACKSMFFSLILILVFIYAINIKYF